MVPDDIFSTFYKQTITKTDQQQKRKRKETESKKRKREDKAAEWEMHFDNLIQYALEIIKNLDNFF